MTRKVYLVGDGAGWRHEARSLLGGSVADPDAGPVALDLGELDRCDALIWNAFEPTWDGPMKAMYARQQGKWVAVVKIGPVPAWVRFVADYVTDSVESACRFVATSLDLEAPCRR